MLINCKPLKTKPKLDNKLKLVLKKATPTHHTQHTHTLKTHNTPVQETAKVLNQK